MMTSFYYNYQNALRHAIVFNSFLSINALRAQNRRRSFSYHTKMDYFSCFVRDFLVKLFSINSEKCIEYGK